MFPQKRRSEYRKQYKKFVISCEGSVTEREYFDRLQSICWNGVTLDILTSRNESSPQQVLERIHNYGKSLKQGDELWCVVDKDHWTAEQIGAVFAWAAEPSPLFRGVAFSNPKFELWLLAHFMDLPATCGPSECDRLLRPSMSVDGKHIVPAAFNLASINEAIIRASVACPDGLVPYAFTGTTVGVLVSHIIASADGFSGLNNAERQQEGC